MAERTIFQEWRRQNEATRYPFADVSTLANAEGRVLVEGTFLDAALYPIGAGVGLFLSSVVVTHTDVTLLLSTSAGVAATGNFKLISPPDVIDLFDAYGRPAGVLVSESRRLGLFQAWGVGTHEFTAAQTEFAATCVFPTPEVGVRGIRLETGETFTGDVWLVGDDGVVLRMERLEIPVSGTNETRRVNAIRVDVVGDPLFRRRLCMPRELFSTPSFVKAIRFKSPDDDFTCGPDAAGNVRLVANNDLAGDSVLRISTTPDAIVVWAVGSHV